MTGKGNTNFLPLFSAASKWQREGWKWLRIVRIMKVLQGVIVVVRCKGIETPVRHPGLNYALNHTGIDGVSLHSYPDF